LGEDEVFLRSLICFVYKRSDITEEEFFSNKSIAKNHIDSGAAILAQLFQECGRSVDGLLSKLAAEVEFSGRKESVGYGLEILVGRTLLDRKELVVEFNNTN